MLGAIAGDVIGSVYEARPHKSKDFPLFVADSSFTDDTVLAVAVADVLLNAGDYAGTLKAYAQRYPAAGYGATFAVWASSAYSEPYGSYGNGSAMRVAAVGWARDDLDAVLAEAAASAQVTHNHVEGIKGAQATAAAIFLGRTGAERDTIRTYLQGQFGYDLSRSVDDIRPGYRFDVSCQGSVPEALVAFLDSVDFEDAVRNAVSLGGDSDTQACIAGAVAEAYYGGLPLPIRTETLRRLHAPLAAVVEEFTARFVAPRR